MGKGLVLAVLVFVGSAAFGQSDQGDLGRAPWPGMTSWDAVWCRELVWKAGFVEFRQPGQAVKVVWLKDVRGWRKPNGFYGLKINGEPVDEGTVWLSYQGRMTNLRVLFTYGSDPVKDVSPFRD